MVNPKTEHNIDTGHGEAVSALMDGEAEAADWQWLDDEAACRQWQHYHIIRECLRHAALQQMGSGMHERSLAALSQRLRETKQDAIDNAPPSHSRLMLLPAANQTRFGRFAMVASVVAVTVAAWQLWPQYTAPMGLPQPAHSEMPASQAVAPLAAPKPAQIPAAIQPTAAQTSRHSASETGVQEKSPISPPTPAAQHM